MSECVTRAAAASAMYISGSTDAVKSGGSWNTCTGLRFNACAGLRLVWQTAPIGGQAIQKGPYSAGSAHNWSQAQAPKSEQSAGWVGRAQHAIHFDTDTLA